MYLKNILNVINYKKHDFILEELIKNRLINCSKLNDNN